MPSPSQISSSGNSLADLMREAFVPPLVAALNDVVSNLRKPMLNRLAELEIDRAPYIDGILQLRERQAAIMAGFQRELDLAWDNGRDSAQDMRHYGSDALADHADDLELVDEDELDVRLATDHFADAIAREWRAELLSLNGYLAWLDSRLRMDAAKGPHSPQRVAIAVYGAFAASGLPGKFRTLAINSSQREFVELMGPIYESLHARLVRHLGPQDNMAPRSRRVSEIPNSEQESPGPEPDWLTTFFADWEDESTPAKTGVEHAETTLPQELQQMLERSRKSRHRETASLATGSVPGDILSRRELVAALTLLQIAPKETHQRILDAPSGLAEGIKAQLVAEARKLGTSNSKAGLSEADANVLDLVGMLFEVIFKESHLTRSQRLSLCQLIAPMAKVALDDRKLFLQSSHPARRLLNALVEASEGNTGETEEQQALLEKVDDVINHLVADFDESLAVFRTLRAEFMAFYRYYQDAAEQAQTVAANGVREVEAQAQILSDARESLASRLVGISLPTPLRNALENGWPEHAARMAVAKRPQSAVMVLNGFMQALPDAGHASDGNTDWTSVVDWLQPIWMGAGHSLEEAARLKQNLLASLQAEQIPEPLSVDVEVIDHNDPEPEPEPEPEPKQDSLLEDGPAPERLQNDKRAQGALRHDNVTAAYFRQLDLGSWLDFVDKNNRVQAGKLSWISPISQRLMFVNRSGARICVVSVEELVLMSQMERVRVHRDEDAFYSAMQGVVDQLAMKA